MFFNIQRYSLLFAYLCAIVYTFIIYMAGIYLHIPFCKSRCVYCDFYSTTAEEKMAAYAEALANELRLRADYLMENGRLPAVETVYFGGGTPSRLNRKALELVFDALYRTYPVSRDAEITFEANPDDLSDDKISLLAGLPVNRLSLGIQTFDDHKLALLHRRHTGRQAMEAVRKCREAGFGNISIDLIYGLPEQTLEEWETDIRTALDLDVQHISAYALTYEEGTVLRDMRERKLVREADEETSLAMYTLLTDNLEAAGFEHYEISNFARKGMRSRHNSGYWTGTPYLGCGAAAHSFDGRNRQWNRPDLQTYIREVGRCRRPEDFYRAPWIEKEELDTAERYNDCIVTALRTAEGLSLTRLRQQFGDGLAGHCLKNAEKHLHRGLLEIKKSSGPQPEDMLRLTRRGLFLSDGIMSDLLYVTD